TGILRANLHSARQRDFFFRAQQVFRMMGLLEDNPRELEIEIVRDTMTALKDEVLLKQSTWHSNRADREDFYLMNYLFQGDKGYTVPELFSMLEAADLQFLGMTQWQSWQLQDVFKDAEHWPALLKTKWPTWSTMEQLNLFELLDPLHRLLDFWCGHPEHQPANRMLQDWTAPDWQRTIVYLHPRLKLDAFRQDLLTCFETRCSFHLNDYWDSKTITSLDNTQAAILLRLWQAPQTFPDLLSHWCHICPVNPITLEPTDHATAFQAIVNLLIQLEASCSILIET
ncbi:MAG: class I SAM-dependent methyltransferase, partial [Leptolyngbyaceae cyanobacterium bins.59]|nr:class I SAM-dependent methyltransferase [Leptolyngbyaceae cyanobacterium bins.59]